MMSNGFTYHLQKLAFFSEFFEGDSLDVGQARSRASASDRSREAPVLVYRLSLSASLLPLAAAPLKINFFFFLARTILAWDLRPRFML